jgi:hypothetical protein
MDLFLSRHPTARTYQEKPGLKHLNEINIISCIDFTLMHLDLTSNISGRPLGISNSTILSSGISQRCISKPRIAFSLLAIKTRFPLLMA